MAKLTPGEQLEKINQLLANYILTGSRQSLSQIRSAVTILLRSAPTMSIRVQETFDAHNLSQTIL